MLAPLTFLLTTDDSKPIDRDVAVLPEVQADSLDEKVPAIMKPYI